MILVSHKVYVGVDAGCIQNLFVPRATLGGGMLALVIYSIMFLQK